MNTRKLVCLILLIVFLLEITVPVYAEINWEGDQDFEYTLPGVGLDAEIGPGLFDPVPVTVFAAGECLITPITEKDLAFLRLDKINEILELLRMFNITLKLIIMLPVISAWFTRILNFTTSKIFIIALELLGMDMRGIFLDYMNDRISCLAGAQRE